jgi:hypothetical protein
MPGKQINCTIYFQAELYGKMSTFGETEKDWGDRVAACLKVGILFRTLPAGSEKIQGNFG